MNRSTNSKSFLSDLFKNSKVVSILDVPKLSMYEKQTEDYRFIESHFHMNDYAQNLILHRYEVLILLFQTTSQQSVHHDLKFITK